MGLTMNDGYVYALINPSLKGLVKIGKTKRTPEIRAQELSASTGVPTPFSVAFEILVNDCDDAENFIHEKLEQRGYRLSPDREFFTAQLKDVISIMYEIQSSQKMHGNQLVPAICNIDFSNQDEEEQFFDQVDDIEEFQNRIDLLETAKSLGSNIAIFQLAENYWHSDNDNSSCLKYYYEATKSIKDKYTLMKCYRSLALISWANVKNPKYCQKCWLNCFQCIDFDYIGIIEIGAMKHYIISMLEFEIPIDDSYLVKFGKDILKRIYQEMNEENETFLRNQDTSHDGILMINRAAFQKAKDFLENYL